MYNAAGSSVQRSASEAIACAEKESFQSKNWAASAPGCHGTMFWVWRCTQETRRGDSRYWLQGSEARGCSWTDKMWLDKNHLLNRVIKRWYWDVFELFYYCPHISFCRCIPQRKPSIYFSKKGKQHSNTGTKVKKWKLTLNFQWQLQCYGLVFLSSHLGLGDILISIQDRFTIISWEAFYVYTLVFT